MHDSLVVRGVLGVPVVLGADNTWKDVLGNLRFLTMQHGIFIKKYSFINFIDYSPVHVL